MKLFTVAAVMIMAGNVRAEQNSVTVCMDRGDNQALAARSVVSKIFDGTGVRIEWRNDERSCKASGAILIGLRQHSGENQHPNALAYALPYEGTHIVVFYDRVRDRAKVDSKIPRLLAYVLTHEITHIIQGVKRHSETGIMKALWDGSDNFRIERALLAFTAEDVEMIHQGLEWGNAKRTVAVAAQRP